MTDKAILYGVNNYSYISDLRGCRNDVQNVRKLLTESFGFNEGNLREYLDADVTKRAIEDGFRWLMDGAESGDRLVFHFSGHGSFIRSENDDEEVDELLCLHSMSWEDHNSYLIDDDLGKLTLSLPQNGARLTVLLDACHSGSGTRGIYQSRAVKQPSPKTELFIVRDTASQFPEQAREDVKRQLESGRTEVLKRLRDEPELGVRARFVDPPLPFRLSRSTRTRRRVGECLSRDQLNHQLVAAAEDDQTAADAFIEGDFQGAFTYCLCDSTRNLGVTAPVRELIHATRGAIRNAGFHQTPKSSGPFSDDPLFGRSGLQPENAPPLSPNLPATPGATVSGEVASDGDVDESTREIVAQVLRLSERAMRLAEELVGRGHAVSEERHHVERASSAYLVYVHGISQHRSGYSNPWWNAMRRYLATPVHRREVLWSDIVNPRSTARVPLDRTVSREMGDAGREIERILEDRLAQTTSLGTADRGAESRMRHSARGGGIQVDDFTRYMFDRDTRERILQRFDSVVRPLLDDGVTLHIVSHSWGTVVAYEGLRNLDATPLAGRVANLFVVGSALSIRPVQSNLFSRVGSGNLPLKVDRVINLDASGDIVGGEIGDVFQVDREYLALSPVGCAKIPFTDTAWNPGCAHSSYFRSANRRVNRDIFARHIDD